MKTNALMSIKFWQQVRESGCVKNHTSNALNEKFHHLFILMIELRENIFHFIENRSFFVFSAILFLFIGLHSLNFFLRFAIAYDWRYQLCNVNNNVSRQFLFKSDWHFLGHSHYSQSAKKKSQIHNQKLYLLR